MDTSKKYIKMCRKAKEIQVKLGKYEDWNSGDYFYYPPDREWDIFEGWGYDEGAIDDIIDSGKCIWLPRQDQLQEMIERYNHKYSLSFFDYISQNSDFIKERFHSYNSIEKHLLAFVIYEKYQKIWDDEKEKWVKQ